MSYYIAGNSVYDSVDYKVYCYGDHDGYATGEYGTKTDADMENDDPYWRLGGNGGEQVAEIGLHETWRLKCTASGIFGYHVDSGSGWIDMFSGGGVGGGASQLSDLSDVNLVSYEDGKVLRADGVDFEAGFLAHGDLSDAPTDAHHSETHVLATTGPHSGSLPLTDIESYSAGRIIYGGVSDWTYLTPGTENYVFKMGATYPAWGQVDYSELAGSQPAPIQHAMDSTTYHSRTDITTLNASTDFHGFLKKLDNNPLNFMNGQGAWATPAGGVEVDSSFPGSPIDGDLYYDTDDEAVYMYSLDALAWIQVGGGGAGIGIGIFTFIINDNYYITQDSTIYMKKGYTDTNLQAAIDYLVDNADGGRIYLPTGDCTINTQILIDGRVDLIGCGYETNLINGLTDDYIIDVTVSVVSIKSLRVTTNATAKHGIECSSSYFGLNDVFFVGVHGSGTHLKLWGAYNMIRNCTFYANERGIESSAGFNGTRIIGCFFYDLDFGVVAQGNEEIVSNNFFMEIDSYFIYVVADNNIITGNACVSGLGIWINDSSDKTLVHGNRAFAIIDGGTNTLEADNITG